MGETLRSSPGEKVVFYSSILSYKLLREAWERGESEDERARILEGIKAGKLSNEKILITFSPEVLE
jgi:hypothetical protein